jgi:hypothetical protein
MKRREKIVWVWWENTERHHSEDRGVDGMVGSDYILGKLAGGCGIVSLGSG